MSKQQLWYELLKRERLRRGWAQSALAERIGSDTRTVSRWEKGEVSPGPYFRQQLSSVFEISIEALGLLSTSQSEESSLSEAMDISSLQNNLSEAPSVACFFGREKECTQVSQWILAESCRIVTVLGMGGIGKTTFVTEVARKLSHGFDRVYWCSLQHVPPIELFLETYFQFVFHTRHVNVPKDFEGQLVLLISTLREQRCLLVLDNFESVLLAGQNTGYYRPGYEGYSEMLRLIGEAEHRSCLLLTSREKPGEIALMGSKAGAIRALPLRGMEQIESRNLLKDQELSGTDETWTRLVALYVGNPLALKLTADFIREVFGGDIEVFLREEATVFGDIERLVAGQFDRLGHLEKMIMYWLALEREAVSLHELRTKILYTGTNGALLEAVESLKRRSLIETHERGFLTLQPVIMEYVTDQFVKRSFEEIIVDQMELLNNYPLIQAVAKDYVRSSQERFILKALAERLKMTFQKVDIAKKLQCLLVILRASQHGLPDYAAGNILNLLVELHVDLRGYDFSHLEVNQAYLQGVDLPDVNFSHATFANAVFTDTFSCILCLATSLDGKLLAAGTTTGEVRIWHAESVTPLFTCSGHSDGVRAIAFSPDGSQLVSGSEDFTLKVWDTHLGVCLRTLRGHTSPVRSVAFHPDRRTIASGGEDETTRTWDAVTGHCYHIWRGHRGWVRSVAFNSDGTLLASGGDDTTIRLWDVAEKRNHMVLQGHSQSVRVITFSCTGNLLASAGDDRSIRLWNTSTWSCEKILRGHTDLIRALTFSPDGTLLASSSDDRFISLWDANTGISLKMLSGQSNRIWSLAFLLDNTTLVSASEDDTLRYWDIFKGQCTRKLHGLSHLIKSIAFSSDGRFVASGSEDKFLRLWDSESGRCLKVLPGHTNRIRSVAFSPDGKYIASGSEDETVCIWNAKTGHVALTLRGHTHLVRSVAFSLDSSFIATGSHDCTIRIWNAKTGECVRVLQGEDSLVWSSVFSPDAQVIASGHDDGIVRFWDSATGACLKRLQGHTHRVWSVAFSPDGTKIASASDDMTIRLWNRSTGQCLQILRGHTLWVRTIAFHVDGKFLVSGSHDMTVRLWDTTTGQCIQVLRGHSKCVWSVTCSSDGKTIASAGDDGAILFWQRDTGECFKSLRSDRPYERINISSVNGLTESQKASLYELGAIEE